jgi:hypothetical protein
MENEGIDNRNVLMKNTKLFRYFFDEKISRIANSIGRKK